MLDELLYADEMAKNAKTEKMQEAMDRVSQACDNYDLTISTKKTTLSSEETISRIDLSDFSLCIVGYSRFWLKVANEESKCIPHEFPRFYAKNATVWCVTDYCLRQ